MVISRFVIKRLPRLFEPRNDEGVVKLKIMKKTVLSYSAPMVNIYEVVAERGYNVSDPIIGGGTSTTLPGFGSEDDSLIY